MDGQDYKSVGKKTAGRTAGGGEVMWSELY